MPHLTIPTTRYKSSRPLPAGLLAGNHAQMKPEPAHTPLVFMLVLSQLAVGLSVAAIFCEPARWLAFFPAVIAALAISIASLHLGKPFKAWRAFLGWRKSWFSREVIVFSGFIFLAAMNATAFWFAPLLPFQKAFAIAAAFTGLLGVFCSAMIYADTHREFWRASQTLGKFFGTTFLLGAVATLTICANTARLANLWAVALVAILSVATAVKLGLEHRIFNYLVDEDTLTLTSLNKTARLLASPFGRAARMRVACGVIGGMLLPLFILLNRANGLDSGRVLAPCALGLCLIGELLERRLFFVTVAPVKMPGGVSA